MDLLLFLKTLQVTLWPARKLQNDYSAVDGFWSERKVWGYFLTLAFFLSTNSFRCVYKWPKQKCLIVYTTCLKRTLVLDNKLEKDGFRLKCILTLRLGSHMCELDVDFTHIQFAWHASGTGSQWSRITQVGGGRRPKGPVRIWVQFRCEFRQKSRPESHLNQWRRTQDPRHNPEAAHMWTRS